MKKLFTILFLIPLFANATNKYWAASGNDANPGTIGSPYQTITKFNSVFATANPGDSFFFNRGDSFYGNLNCSSNGASGNVIFIGAYGSGALPIITGLSSVTGWVNISGNIWESGAITTVIPYLNMVVINGVNTPMGRTPNTGYYVFQTHSGNTSITSSNINGFPDYTGGEVVIRSAQYILDRATISSQSGSTLNFPAISSTPTNGFGFFIQNDSLTLDQQNEWWYKKSTQKLRIYSTTSPTNIQASTIDTLVWIRGNYITFDHLDFEGANDYAFFNDWGGSPTYGYGDYLTVQNCHINYSGIYGIWTLSKYMTVNNCSFNNSNNTAIYVRNSPINITVTNDTIKNTGVNAGMGQSGFAIYTGILILSTKNSTITNNIVTNTGYIPIYSFGDSAIIKNNFVDSFCSVLNDGGGIYIDRRHHGIQITYNIVLDGLNLSKYGTADTTYTPSEGIYLDDTSSNVLVAYNSISNCANQGIFLHNGDSNNINNNTVFNCKRAIGTQDDGSNMFNDTIKNNIFVAKISTQVCAYFVSATNNITTLGFLDSNYYARPIKDDSTITYAPSYSFHTTTLSGWQSYSGQDAHSKKSPKSVTDTSQIKFYYNATGSVGSPINLPAQYIDMPGNVYSIVTLQPYSSIVLLYDAPLPPPPGSTVYSLLRKENTIYKMGH